MNDTNNDFPPEEIWRPWVASLYQQPDRLKQAIQKAYADFGEHDRVACDIFVRGFRGMLLGALDYLDAPEAIMDQARKILLDWKLVPSTEQPRASEVMAYADHLLVAELCRRGWRFKEAKQDDRVIRQLEHVVEGKSR